MRVSSNLIRIFSCSFLAALAFAPLAFAGSGYTINPSSVQLSVVAGSTAEVPATLTVSNSSPTAIQFQIFEGNSSCSTSVPSAWLTLSATQLNVPAEQMGQPQSQSFGITLSPVGLAVGTYASTLCFTTSANGMTAVPVTLQIAQKTIDVVYLNRCASGCVVTAGTDDAINHVSSLVRRTVTVPAFAYSDDVFDQSAACVRTVLAPFNIHVVSNDPGSAPRREIMITTLSQDIGPTAALPIDVPLTGTSQDNRIGFAFATETEGDVNGVCWYIAAAVGALYGLDLVTNCSDIMSLNTCGEKSFTNVESPCGGDPFDQPGECVLGNSTQNSFETIRNVAGAPSYIFINSFEGFEVPSSGPSL